MAHNGLLVAPTACLPKLSMLADCSVEQLTQALDNLRALYCRAPTPPLSLTLPAKHLHKHLIHDMSAPDSGYASAEDDEVDEDVLEETSNGDTPDPDILRSDAFERDFAIRWLTGFTARFETWVHVDSEEESDARVLLVDSAAAILAALAGEQEEEALTRRFTFPYGAGEGEGKDVGVELNDAPLLSTDHTSVGLQSWASSILLSERLSADPRSFALDARLDAMPPRVLELGAGTGLLSIVSAKILQLQGDALAFPLRPTVVATDYHPSVLDNLRVNVGINFSSDSATPVAVRSLDWEHPVYEGELSRTFDVIFAADVVYHPEHARWIRTCVERLLVRPSAGDGAEGGVFWLIVPLRIAGHHQGMSDTIEEVFPKASANAEGQGWTLAVLAVEEMQRCNGVGRADEGGYKLFRIGWVRA
ncbi:hypothetical protein DAEQUDRAFT_741627 [Daedalea quercina L-15889]|uniref:S-adenosyl-L-methionine-dependent methyltransferase n=1 Tax=Daedalea quercina L-15889 TaxID=1314783 RepID=A0A165L4W0_9APHY|nr:hypothetical protein DAEQUDRAFT_741627 [Daedalea quercina L-15889]